jgi:hypothetical protein
MSKSQAKSFVIAISIFVGLILAGLLVRARLGQVGGLSPTYEARDHDPRLTLEAATARPLIAALVRYHAEHGRFPAEISALGVSSNAWTYTPQPSGFALSKKLGWDPTLHYKFEQERGRWVFEPGDGSPERELTF